MKSSFLADFKKFAMRGNVIDMAVGVIDRWRFWKNRIFGCRRYHHATSRVTDRRCQLYRFKMGDERARSSRWGRTGCGYT